MVWGDAGVEGGLASYETLSMPILIRFRGKVEFGVVPKIVRTSASESKSSQTLKNCHKQFLTPRAYGVRHYSNKLNSSTKRQNHSFQ